MSSRHVLVLALPCMLMHCIAFHHITARVPQDSKLLRPSQRLSAWYLVYTSGVPKVGTTNLFHSVLTKVRARLNLSDDTLLGRGNGSATVA